MFLLELIENLSLDLACVHVLSCLELKDLVRFERASANNHQSKLLLQSLLPHCLPVRIRQYEIISKVLSWLEKAKCPIYSVMIRFPSPFLNSKIVVRNYHLYLSGIIYEDDIEQLIQNEINMKITKLKISYVDNIQILEQLAVHIPNVKKLCIQNFKSTWSTEVWLTNKLLNNWNLSDLTVRYITTDRINAISSHLHNLTYLELLYTDFNLSDDTTIIAILQACPQLIELHLCRGDYTYHTLLAISNRAISLKILDIPIIPIIPTADIAKQCSHALSCIRQLGTTMYIHGSKDNVEYCIPYLTGLNVLVIDIPLFSNILPLLTQYCHNIHHIVVKTMHISANELLTLLCSNPYLKILRSHCRISMGITDTSLIQLVHACPHLHILRLSEETTITDIRILAISVHCTQLKELDIGNSKKVTETAILQLLQHCRQLRELSVSKLSLSAETAAEVKRTRNINIYLK